MTDITSLFESLRDRDLSIETIQVCHIAFRKLRRSVRKLFNQLGEMQNCDDLIIELRTYFLKWLTAPVDFNTELVKAKQILPIQTMRASFGLDICNSCDEMLESIEELAEDPNGNPFHAVIERQLNDAVRNNKTFRIFCYKKDRELWKHLMADLEDNVFICSPSEYRNSELFDILVKAGPLRPSGWGSVPDGILTAPRFQKLIQIIWNGSPSMKGDIGYDPISSNETLSASDVLKVNELTWKRIITRTGQPEFGKFNEEDDFDFIERHSGYNREEMIRATLLVFTEDLAMFVPYGSQVTIISNDAFSKNEKILEVHPDETAGSHLVIQKIENLDLGGGQERHGALSRIWKKHLMNKIVNVGLSNAVYELHNMGLNLITLNNRLLDWCREDRNVIPAPRQMEHFRHLIAYLDIPDEAGNQYPFWQRAWQEIRHFRGEAITDGRIHQDILNDCVHDFIERNLDEIQDELHERDIYSIEIPEEEEISGTLQFLRVHEIENRFQVPNTHVKILMTVSEADQWRE